jgi:hypothetical protein
VALQYFEQQSPLDWHVFPIEVHAVLAAHVTPSAAHCWLSHALWSHAHLPMSESQWHLLYIIPLEQ